MTAARQARAAALLVGALLLAACGGGGSDKPKAAPSLGAAPPGSVGAGTQPTIPPAQEVIGSVSVPVPQFTDQAGTISFLSPAGDVNCSISQGQVVAITCQLPSFSYTVKEAGSCPNGGTWGGTVELQDAPMWVCTPNPVAGLKPLDFGGRIDVLDINCVSRPDGITCQKRSTGHGFRISKAFYTFF
jgi:hypothetical protein